MAYYLFYDESTGFLHLRVGTDFENNNIIAYLACSAIFITAATPAGSGIFGLHLIFKVPYV